MCVCACVHFNVFAKIRKFEAIEFKELKTTQSYGFEGVSVSKRVYIN